MIAVRACPMCGKSLLGRRSDATYCSAPCRVEAWRLRRLLDGQPAGRYRAVRDRLGSWGTRPGNAKPRRQNGPF